MAVDTPAKRSSMLNWACGLSFNLLPIPDGSYDAGDRQHLLGLYRGIAFGAISETLTLLLKLGSVTLISTGALTPTSGLTDKPWKMEGYFIVRSTGASGTVMASAEYDAVGSKGQLANAGTITIDDTTSAVYQVAAEWGVADAGNSVTVQNLVIEKVNI